MLGWAHGRSFLNSNPIQREEQKEKCSRGAQQSDTCVGWRSPKADQDQGPKPQSQAKKEVASDELSDSADSSEKFPLIFEDLMLSD